MVCECADTSGFQDCSPVYRTYILNIGRQAGIHAECSGIIRGGIHHVMMLEKIIEAGAGKARYPAGFLDVASGKGDEFHEIFPVRVFSIGL